MQTLQIFHKQEPAVGLKFNYKIVFFVFKVKRLDFIFTDNKLFIIIWIFTDNLYKKIQ